MQLDRPLEEGYQIGYTNNIETGMSGGPILNQQGYLVGINGRLKYPLGGIDTFKFTDGKFPRWSDFKQMEMLSWGIPIETVLGFLDSEKPRNRVSFLPPTVNLDIDYRNPVSLRGNPETGFLFCHQQLTLISTTETRFLCVATQKPGFFFATNS